MCVTLYEWWGVPTTYLDYPRRVLDDLYLRISQGPLYKNFIFMKVECPKKGIMIMLIFEAGAWEKIGDPHTVERMALYKVVGYRPALVISKDP